MHKLERPRPVMITTGQDGYDMFIFQSCDKIYVWERHTDAVDLIKSSYHTGGYHQGNEEKWILGARIEATRALQGRVIEGFLFCNGRCKCSRGFVLVYDNLISFYKAGNEDTCTM